MSGAWVPTSAAAGRGSGLWLLLARVRPEEWGGHPACAEADPELFFPVSDADAPTVAEALAYCAVCPVRVSCEQFATRTGQHGIWGGTTEEYRNRARRQTHRRPAAAREGRAA